MHKGSSGSTSTAAVVPQQLPALNVTTNALTPEQRQACQKYFDELKKTTSCHNCGRLGHWQGECPDLSEAERLEARQNRRLRSSTTSLSRAFSAVDTTSDLPIPEATHTGFMAYECSPTLATEPLGDHSYNSRHHIWYVDIAASSHMTGHRDWFVTYTKFLDSYWPIQGITPEPMYAAGVGNISIERLINGRWLLGHIDGVLHVPGLATNLFSITKAAHKNVQTTFSLHGYTMICQGATVLQGTLQNSLYELQLRIISPNVETALVAASFRPATVAESRQSLQTWHARLCHINYESIKLLVHRELAHGIELLEDTPTDTSCAGCSYGKQHRTPFPVNLVRATATHPGALIHADIMGPMDTKSVGGAFYILLLKDDATGYRIVFCLKHKFDALSALQQAFRQVLRDTGYHVRVLRCDRGGEFISKRAKQFFDDQLIR